MVREREDPRTTRCAVCWQMLRPKSPLLHGMKCVRFEIKEKLRFLLPPQDFKLLFDETIFPSPRICNMCFVTIKKIPRTIAKLQSLVGKKINTKLYKPHRAEWNDTSDDVGIQRGRTGDNVSDIAATETSAEGRSNISSGEQSTSLFQLPQKDYEGDLKSPFGMKTNSPEPLTEITGESDNDGLHEELQEEDQNSQQISNRNSASSSSSHLSTENTNQDLYGRVVQRSKVKKEIADPAAAVEKTDNFPMTLKRKQGRVSRKTKSVASSSVNERWSLRSRGKTSAVSLKTEKVGKKQKISQKENQNVDLERKSQRSVPLRNRKKKSLAEDYGSFDSDSLTDIPISDEEDEYIPPSKTKKSERAKVKSTLNNLETKSGQLRIRTKGKVPSTTNLQRKRKLDSSKRDLKESEQKPTVTSRLSTDTSMNDEIPDSDSKADESGQWNKFHVKDDIPDNLKDHSKAKLEGLAKDVLNYIRAKKLPEQAVMIKCSINNCSHAYPLWVHVAIHVKYYHYDGASSGDSNFTQKMFMLAELGKPDPESYRFQCGQEGCDMAFTSKKSLDAHLMAHKSNLKFMCEFPDCCKAFRLLRSLQVHSRSHTGERPFLCAQPGCGKSFKDSKDLAKHKSRHTGEKSHQCEFEDCGKTFFTISELNSHKGTHMKSESWCCDVCGRQYCSEKGLMRHKRRMHGIGKPGSHKCPYPGCEESFVKKEKLEIHMCSHSPERRLFCEKCGKKFSCQRYLDVHYKIHQKNEEHAANPPTRTIPCEAPGCDKMFTTRENMKSHVLNQHRGRKPRSVPGVFYPCTVEGCGKKFSFRSTLYRHNKLVHKGGDYKLGREVVKYACTYTSCNKEFNRKNLLEEHMVMEHGKTPKRLLPLQNKDLDFTEGICDHCGMVLTVTQLPRHQQVYHSHNTAQDMKEISPFPCHLKNCLEVFNTQEDRKAHVQLHIESPPFKCGVGDCQATFFLEKNLDNHLWDHSKKASICPVQGCGRHFEDQLHLAKHSKVHYNGKMKCPWPNCDNWLSETGHLKPHFIAHSRSLMANMDWDFVCEICELAFNSKWGLMIHKRMHGEEAAAKATRSRLAKFTCEEPGCQATLADQKGFFDHFLYHYTCTPVSCDFAGCSQSFKNLITMSRHSKVHYDGKFRCPWQGCTKLFASVFIVKKHLYRHILTIPMVAADRPFSCKQCFMVFRYQSNYSSHQEHHNEKSDYICPTCGKEGRHNHMKTPKFGNKPRKSQECQQCGARYATVSGLKFHLLQKHKIGKWPFSCSYCGKGFVSSREMQRHIPSHTKEKPFTCSLCQASFASHTGHRAHMRKHTGQKYVCDVEGCGKVYTTPISLRGHKAQHEGFNKTCPYCFKTYKNPYGHKCKASRDSKRKENKLGQNQMVRPMVSLPAQTMMPAAPPTPAAAVPALIATLTPSTTGTIQQQQQQQQQHHQNMAPQQVLDHSMDIQHANRALVGAPNPVPHPHMMQHNLPQSVQQPDLGQGMTPQTLPPGLPNQNLIPDRTVQAPVMDMSRAAGNTGSMDVTGDYTFNNYIVFWDNHNMS